MTLPFQWPRRCCIFKSIKDGGTMQGPVRIFPFGYHVRSAREPPKLFIVDELGHELTVSNSLQDFSHLGNFARHGSRQVPLLARIDRQVI